jgi:hypothetical protein
MAVRNAAKDESTPVKSFISAIYYSTTVAKVSPDDLHFFRLNTKHFFSF